MIQLPRRWYTVITLFLGFLTCGYLLRRVQTTRLQSHTPITGHYAPLHVDKLPKTSAKSLPIIQTRIQDKSATDRKARIFKQDEVKRTFVRCWKAYKDHAFGFDEIKPLTGKSDTTFGGWGATLVDSLDTLWIMGLKTEFEEAVVEVAKINFTSSEQTIVNVFETTIRYLGGLLGAYDVSEGAYPTLLSKAVELGEILYQAFDTPQRIPVTRWNWLESGQSPSTQTIVAELGSLTLEFTRLSQLTGDSKYYDAVYRIMLAFEMSQDITRIPGLWPTIVDANQLTFSGTHFTIGGMSDSLYEYLPKEHILLSGSVPSYEEMYKSALKAMKKHLFFRPSAPDLKQVSKQVTNQAPQAVDVLFAGNAFLGSKDGMVREAQGQHLGCFAGGMVALAAKTFKREKEDMATAKKLVDGCIWAYDSSALGIMPETFHLVPCEDAQNCVWDEGRWLQAVTSFSREETAPNMPLDDFARKLIREQRLPQGFANIRDRRYILRPEAIESIFILYRITGEEYLREAAWRMFSSINKATWAQFGHASIRDVTVPPEEVQLMDLQESFWLAETLKYFYLIFSEDTLISLDDYVLNTEAHPFRRPKPGSSLRDAAAFASVNKETASGHNSVVAEAGVLH